MVPPQLCPKPFARRAKPMNVGGMHQEGPHHFQMCAEPSPNRCSCRFLPCPCCLPRLTGGSSASTTSLCLRYCREPVAANREWIAGQHCYFPGHCRTAAAGAQSVHVCEVV